MKDGRDSAAGGCGSVRSVRGESFSVDPRRSACSAESSSGSAMPYESAVERRLGGMETFVCRLDQICCLNFVRKNGQAMGALRA